MSDRTHKWLTVFQVADMLQLSEDYVRSLIQNGQLKAVKFPGGCNGPVRVAETCVVEFLESCEIRTPETLQDNNEVFMKKNSPHRRRRSASADSWGV